MHALPPLEELLELEVFPDELVLEVFPDELDELLELEELELDELELEELLLLGQPMP